ncbi:hypothetical protein CsSME_00047708 [Camellia sinensis var. sinensis]
MESSSSTRWSALLFFADRLSFVDFLSLHSFSLGKFLGIFWVED